MDFNEPDPELVAQPQLPAWIKAIDDQNLCNKAEHLYLHSEEIRQRHDSNLRFISILKSQCSVQQDKIDRLQRHNRLMLSAVGGGLIVIGLTVLLMINSPTLGHAAAAFLIVLLGRACFPALSHFFLSHFLKSWGQKNHRVNWR